MARKSSKPNIYNPLPVSFWIIVHLHNAQMSCYLQRNISLCQTSIGIVRCHASKILDPAENLKSQTTAGNSMILTSTLRNDMVGIMTKFNFHRTLAGTVSWNSQYCKDKYYCTGAYLAPTDIRREIYRQSESLLSWITNQNEALEMLHTIVTLWGHILYAQDLYS